MRKGKGYFAVRISHSFFTAVFVSLLFLFLFVSSEKADAFRLPDTGQTLCFDSSGNQINCTGTGQDGAYGINPMSLTSNEDGTMTDNNTGLMWQSQDDGNNYNWYQATGTHDATYNPDSQNVCGSLSLGGYSDWRLPSEKELTSIASYAVSLPLYPACPVTAADWWSSSEDSADPGQAWLADFTADCMGVGGGIIASADKGLAHAVLCVRDGRYPAQDFMDNEDGTVTDNATGLMWQQGDFGGMAWQTALDYCNNLSLGGHSDWRLPNVKELQSINDSTRYDPAIDTTFFPDAYSSDYWTSTTAAAATDGAWTVSFNYSGVSYSPKASGWFVRCVRGGTTSERLGVYDNGNWYLDSNASLTWDGTPTDMLYEFGVGLTGAVPVTGDWNGDGTTKIGIFLNGTWYLDANGNGQWDGVDGGDRIYTFGTGLTSAVPVAGDWNGDGTTKIGVFVDGTWYLDINGNGQWDGVTGGDRMDYFGMGLTAAVPVVGDWNGDGKAKLGVYQNGYWYLDADGSGQWDGEPTDRLAVFGIGLQNAVPVAGDWNAHGIDEPGIFQGGLWYLDKNGNGQWDGATTDQSAAFGIGLTGALPVPGKW